MPEPVRLRVVPCKDKFGPTVMIEFFDPGKSNFRCAMPSMEVATLIAESVGIVQLLAEAHAKGNPSVGDCGDYTQMGEELLNRLSIELAHLPTE